MKDIVLRIPFKNNGTAYIEQFKGDNEEFCLKHYDKKLDLTFIIVRGGDTDGGSIPAVAQGAFKPVLANTIHGYITHDELWAHRVLLQEQFKEYGLSFSETNRIMSDIHKKSDVSYLKRKSIYLGVQVGGYIKWSFPSDEIKNKTKQTLFIERGNKI